jgi:hypothetical protein
MDDISPAERRAVLSRDVAKRDHEIEPTVKLIDALRAKAVNREAKRTVPPAQQTLPRQRLDAGRFRRPPNCAQPGPVALRLFPAA